MEKRSIWPDDYQDIPRLVSVLSKKCGETVSPWHCHKRGQLMYGLQGVIAVTTKRGTWIIPPQRAVWIPPGIEHSTRTIKMVGMRTVFIAPEATRDLPQHDCVIQVTPLLRELINRAAALPLFYDASGPCGRIAQLIVDEIRDSREQPFSLSVPSDLRISDICRTLLENPRCNCTLKDFAKMAHATPRTIERSFRRATGMTFNEWRLEARLFSALVHLASGKSVKQVAFASGYTSQSAFTNTFSRIFGTTPSQYFLSISKARLLHQRAPLDPD